MTPETWLAGLDRVGFQAARVLLSVLWQSSILLAAAAVLAFALRRRRSSVRHAVWTAALLAVPLLPLLGWAASAVRAPRAEIRVMPAYVPHDGAPPVAVSAVAEPPVATLGAEAVPPALRFPSPLAYPWALALVGYALGASVFLSLVVVGQVRIMRWARSGTVAASPRVVAAWRSARSWFGLADDAPVIEHPCVRTPMTVGLLHPLVLLPAGFADNVSAAELEAVALHELAHVKRRDALVLGLLSVVRGVLFFHPLVWLACRQVSMLTEAAADDAVLDATGEPVSYAKLLARLAESLPKRALSTELAAGFIVSKGAFLRRIRAILSDRRGRIRRLSRAALLVTILAAAASVAVALALPLGEKADLKQPLGEGFLLVKPTVVTSAAVPPAGTGETIVLDAKDDHVRMQTGDAVLEADRIVIEPGSGKVTATGNAGVTGENDEAVLSPADLASFLRTLLNDEQKTLLRKEMASPTAPAPFQRADDPEIGAPAWQALARFVRPGMTVSEMRRHLPRRPARENEPLEIFLWNGNAFRLVYPLDEAFGVEASGIRRGKGDDGLVLGSRPRIRPLAEIWQIRIEPAVSSASGDAQPADARETVEAFVAAALAGDDAATRRFIEAGKADFARELRATPDDNRIKVQDVYAGRDDAIAASSPIADDRGREGHLIFRLRRKDGPWRIHDVDFESAQVTQAQVGAFRIHRAIERGDVARVRALLDAQPNLANAARISPTVMADYLPLSTAVYHGQGELVRLLLDRGAEINAAGYGSQTALHEAAACGRKAIVRRLLARGADLKATDLSGFTPLHTAVRNGLSPEAIAILLDAGADPNDKGKAGLTPLALAVLFGRDAGPWKAGADRLAKSTGPDIFVAAARGDADRLRTLVETDPASAKARAFWNLTPLHAAAARGHRDAAAMLLAGGAEIDAAAEGWGTPLTTAVRGGHADVARLLLAHGADAADPAALQMAAASGQTECLGLLVAAGADVNRRDRQGRTPLHAAARSGRRDAAAFLLARGANLRAASDNGHTVLHEIAAQSALLSPAWAPDLGPHLLETAALLIDKGADVNARDRSGRTPLLEAADRRLKELTNAATPPPNAHNTGLVRLLVAHGADVAARDGSGHTALDYAIERRNAPVARILLAGGADPQEMEAPTRKALGDLVGLSPAGNQPARPVSGAAEAVPAAP